MTKLRRPSLFITFTKPRPKPGEGGGPVTTMMSGEESSRPDPGTVTTMAHGEEGRDR